VTDEKARPSRREEAAQASALRSDRLAKAAARTAATGDPRPLLDEAAHVLAAADPQRRIATARAVGQALARERGKVERALNALTLDSAGFWPRAFAAAAFAQRAVDGVDPRGADEALQALAESDADVREAVIDALRTRLDAQGEGAGIEELRAWTDGYLQAHVALAALADKTRLAAMTDAAAEAVVLRLDEAYTLADKAPRSADRSQGLRTLRRALPEQITLFAGRFSRVVFAWLDTKLAPKQPETREVVAATIARMKKASLPLAEAARLRATLDASAKPRRDLDRVVTGTRGRGKR
jgi:hypothetical protein